MGKKVTMTNLPGMEFATTRRVTATPITAAEAGEINLPMATKPENKKAVGFHVKEPVGAKVFEYWMDEASFMSSHLRTDKYTIGEAMILLSQGATLRRPFWPPNMFIKFEGESKIGKAGKNQMVRGAQISRVGIHEDPMAKGKFDIVLENWIPSQEDLWAKDYQTVNIDFSNVSQEKVDRKE